MRILVLVKRVPATGGRINLAADGRSIDTSYLGFVVSPHEECAVEEGVRLVEAHGGAVTVMTLGPAEADQHPAKRVRHVRVFRIHLVRAFGEFDRTRVLELFVSYGEVVQHLLVLRHGSGQRLIMPLGNSIALDAQAVVRNELPGCEILRILLQPVVDHPLATLDISGKGMRLMELDHEYRRRLQRQRSLEGRYCLGYAFAVYEHVALDAVADRRLRRLLDDVICKRNGGDRIARLYL